MRTSEAMISHPQFIYDPFHIPFHQYENILTKSVECNKNNYNVIRPSLDTLVQIETPCYSLRKMVGRFPSGEKTASSFCFLRVFTCFFAETHGRGLRLVAHVHSD